MIYIQATVSSNRMTIYGLRFLNVFSRQHECTFSPISEPARWWRHNRGKTSKAMKV